MKYTRIQLTDVPIPEHFSRVLADAETRCATAERERDDAQRKLAAADSRLAAYRHGYRDGHEAASTAGAVVVTEAVAPAHRIIDTEADLYALPYEAVVRETARGVVGDCYVWEHRGDRRWVPASESAVLRDPILPVVVLFDPST